jgi:hypothetical protein
MARRRPSTEASRLPARHDAHERATAIWSSPRDRTVIIRSATNKQVTANQIGCRCTLRSKNSDHVNDAR